MWNKQPVVRQSKLYREQANRVVSARAVNAMNETRLFREGSHDVVEVTGEMIVEDTEEE